MKSQTMSADDFRKELRRLGLGQSAFAEATDVPLRTVQSWALGERRVPQTVRGMIEKVEHMPLSAKLAAIIIALPKEKQKIMLDLGRLIAGLSKQIKVLKKQNIEQASDIAKLRAEFERLRNTCIFQAEKISAYEQDVRRRSANAIPFNAGFTQV